MGLSRRELLVGLAWVALPLPMARVRAASPDIRRTLGAYVDTLLPADDFTPGASDLGVHEEVLAGHLGQGMPKALLRKGCRWLDHQAGGDFSRLTDGQRHRLVAWMAQANGSRGPRVFYDYVRRRAVTLYYAHPESWAGSPLTHTPQPRGYIDELMALEHGDV
ncbi:gluconate 2-dehydrogenase subunit 3 family protein [Arhodomonas aquaeolei]|uniref:gluconate 2-dehydrogenase subunit 3 family protein n=1 Tax=Arhodomonas aquaeolei TaxID=2369 RepID=UPI00146C29AB|nr:gluconate 2-dehydrogenase subunit 3 family protein [Arhodomonas aquaeolei]